MRYKTFKIIGGLLLLGVTVACTTRTPEKAMGNGLEQKGDPPSVEEVFAQMDANKDGKLSKSEVKGPLKNDFDKVDKNGDGFISKEELKKAPKPKRKGPPPARDN